MAARARTVAAAAAAEPDDDAELLIVPAGDGAADDAGGEGAGGDGGDPDDPDDGPADGPADELDGGPGPPAPGGLLLRYGGGDALALPARYSRAGLVDAARRAAVDAAVAAGRPVAFLPTAVEETTWFKAAGCGRPGCGGGAHSLLRLHGATRDGAKACVTICGLDIFFDLLVAHRDGWEYPRPTPDDPPPADPEAGTRAGAPVPARTEAEIDALTEAARRRLAAVVDGAAERDEARPPRPTAVDAIDARWFHGYHEAPSRFLRVRFATLAARKRIADEAARHYETASDQPTCHYRKFSAETGTPLADWLVVARAGARLYASRVHVAARPGARDPAADGVLDGALDGSGESKYDGAWATARAGEPAAEREFWAAPANVTPLADPALRARLPRAPAAVAAFDIETLALTAHGDLPRPERPGDHAFMACATLAWQDDAEPAAAVCVTAFESAPDPRWLTVVAGGATLAERCRNVTRALGLVLRAFAPDVVADFNGSDYDWPFLVEKARRERELGRLVAAVDLGGGRARGEAAAYEWNYKQGRRVKLGADAAPALCSHLEAPGWVAVDVRVAFRRLYPKAEKSSLKYFLGLAGLPSKADMPIARLWRACRRSLAAEAGPPRPDSPRPDTLRPDSPAARPDSPRPDSPAGARPDSPAARPDAPPHAAGPENPRLAPPAEVAARGAAAAAALAAAAEEMRAVAHYCVVDAARCQSLLVRRGVLADYRAVATRSFTSLADAHYNADGMKVRNAACHFAAAAGFVASHRRQARPPEGKYPGAHVFPPVRGVIPDPVAHAALDDLLASPELAPLRAKYGGSG